MPRGRKEVRNVGACVNITCPKCEKVFIASPSMLGQGVDYHCPFCNTYFPEEKAVKIVK